ncbi:hypothetical protein HMPREF1199_01368 [Hoylesella oralis CC98A]|nr:hypothetical protein HMPREF1199_01368 [Hoylesella oralis CC98A]
MCGVVMQDGKMFSDTIANNIVLDDDHIDKKRLIDCCKTAQILDEINSMSQGFDTKIGDEAEDLVEGKSSVYLLREPCIVIHSTFFYTRQPMHLILSMKKNCVCT